ncbi:MAG: RNA-binding protein [Telmatospirillum sp.]|nr:RNA-binding protein [Telmatospirillum sp.]
MADEDVPAGVAWGPNLGHDDADGEKGALEEEKGPNRRCIASGQVLPVERLIRFVVGPDGNVVPDIEAVLPGRGLWLSASRDMVNTAATKNLFAKAFRRKVGVPPDLSERIEALLLRRCIDRIGLARRAGQAICGFEKVRGELKAGHGALLLAAADGAADGRDKIRALAPDLPLVAVFRGEELGAAFGRDRAVHALLTVGRLADGLKVDAARLAGFRPE